MHLKLVESNRILESSNNQTSYHKTWEVKYTSHEKIVTATVKKRTTCSEYFTKPHLAVSFQWTLTFNDFQFLGEKDMNKHDEYE